MDARARRLSETMDRRRGTPTDVAGTVAAALTRSALAAAGRLGVDPRVLALEAGPPGRILEDNRARGTRSRSWHGCDRQPRGSCPSRTSVFA